MSKPTLLLASAMRYVDSGWPVLPLHSMRVSGRCTCGKSQCNAAKHPRTRKGLNDATTNVEQVKRWWSAHPDSNVGIKTGKVSGLVILDVDERSDGFASLQRLADEIGPLPDTLTVETGGGGCHFYFAYPEGVDTIKSRSGALGAGLDIKADGGYVVAPPSMHQSGTAYAWRPGAGLDDVTLAPLPANLLARLIEPISPPQAGALMTVPPPQSLSLGQVVAVGGRNHFLTRHAGKLRYEGNRYKAIETGIQQINQEWCSPPLPCGEVSKIAESVNRYAGRTRKQTFHNWLRSPECPAPPTTRHILREVARYMDKDGGSSYPTIEMIAVATGLSQSAVKRNLTTATEKGWIGRYPHRGNGQAWKNYGYFIPQQLLADILSVLNVVYEEDHLLPQKDLTSKELLPVGG